MNKKHLILLIPFLLIFITKPVFSQSAGQDSTAIRNTALDYIEGWYSGDAERMGKALHPNLAKRIVVQRQHNGREYSEIIYTSALELVQQTRAGGGSDTPGEKRKTEVTIQDMYGNAASVRVDAGGWVDYMHMAKWQEEWKIINVLWALNPNQED